MLVWDRQLLSGAISPAYSSDGMILTERLNLSKAYAISAHYCEKCKLFLSMLTE